MKRSWWKAALLIVAAAPVWASSPPPPGTVNYIEGQAAIDAKAVAESSVGSVMLGAGQTLSTDNGRAEVLLTPGVFLRVANQSSVRMNSAGIENTQMALEKGRAMVEVDYIRPENNIRVAENGSSTRLLKPGLYDFDADRATIRVFDGRAEVEALGKAVQLKGGHELSLNAAKVKAESFDKKASVDDFYKWSSLRSGYLADANVEAARQYAGSGYAPSLWYGAGWYWDPWFDAYTFIPGEGIFYDPFGFGFFSPYFAYQAPYLGFGYVGGGYYRHFAPGYRPRVFAGAPAAGFVGHAHSIGRGAAGINGVVANRGAVGGAGATRSSGGFHAAGGGFHAAGGGFHGGGGGGRR